MESAVLASTLYRIDMRSIDAASSRLGSRGSETSKSGSVGSRPVPATDAPTTIDTLTTTSKPKIPEGFKANYFKDEGYDPPSKRQRLDNEEQEAGSVIDTALKKELRLCTGLSKDVDINALDGGLRYYSSTFQHKFNNTNYNYSSSLQHEASASDNYNSNLNKTYNDTYKESDRIIGLAMGADISEDLPLSMLASHLLVHPGAKAYYIDGESSSISKLLRLRGILASRLKRKKKRDREALRHEGGYVYSRGGGDSDEDLEEGHDVGHDGTHFDRGHDGIHDNGHERDGDLYGEDSENEDIGGDNYDSDDDGGQNYEKKRNERDSKQSSSKLEDKKQKRKRKHKTDEEEKEVQREAEEVLSRLDLMRVLDFEGLLEAVGEIGTTLRRATSSTTSNDNAVTREMAKFGAATDEAGAVHDSAGDRIDVRPDTGHGDSEDAASSSTQKNGKPLRPENTEARNKTAMEIADSEDEEEELVMSPILDERAKEADAMDTSEEVPIADNSNNTPTAEIANQMSTHQKVNNETITTEEQGPYLIMTSSLPKLVTPLMKRNHVSGHALLSNLLRSLRHLVQECDGLLVVLCNSVVSSYPSRSSGNPGKERSVKHEEPSAFMDVSARPALGRTFNWGLDISLMAFPYPSVIRRSVPEDSDEIEQLSQSILTEKRTKTVVEVLHDRVADRTGRWGVYSSEAED